MNDFESWRNITAPATLRSLIVTRQRRPARRTLAFGACLVLLFVPALLLLSSRSSSAASLYSSMWRRLDTIQHVHWVSYGPSPRESGFAWTDNWFVEGWMRRDGLEGRRFLKGPGATWAWRLGELTRENRPGQVIPSPQELMTLSSLSGVATPRTLGRVRWRGMDLSVVSARVVNSGNGVGPEREQRFTIWIDERSQLPVYLENEAVEAGAPSLIQQLWFFYDDPVPAALFRPENLARSADEIQSGLTRRGLDSLPRP